MYVHTLAARKCRFAPILFETFLPRLSPGKSRRKSIVRVLKDGRFATREDQVDRAIVVRLRRERASLLPPRTSSRVERARIPRSEVLFIVNGHGIAARPRFFSFFLVLPSSFSAPIIAASYYVGTFSGGERSRSRLDKGHSRRPRYRRNISDNARTRSRMRRALRDHSVGHSLTHTAPRPRKSHGPDTGLTPIDRTPATGDRR